MLRQAAQTSQAFFLSTVLPKEDFSSGGSPPITPKPRHWSSASGPAPVGGRPGESRRARPGAGGVTVTSAVADKEAVARWASLRRLQDQGVGLGSAIEHQLGRALDLCRNLRGLQVCTSRGRWVPPPPLRANDHHDYHPEWYITPRGKPPTPPHRPSVLSHT